MTSSCFISAADFLLSNASIWAHSLLVSLLGPAGPRSDALLAFVIGILLIVGSSVARALTNLSRKQSRHIAAPGRRAAYGTPAANATPATPSRIDAA
jgi:hypothetical protein